MKNEVLDRSMQAAKNLMKIEIKDRDKDLHHQIHQLRNDGTLRSLERQVDEILEAEKADIIQNCRWLQALVEATQDAIFGIGPEAMHLPEEQETIFRGFGKTPLTDDQFIIPAYNVLSEIHLYITDTGFDVAYTINQLLIPWAESSRFKIKNYTFTEEETAVIYALEEHRERIRNLEAERKDLQKKLEEMDDVLLRVETDLLLKQLKADDLGEQSIDTVKDLIQNYLGNKALPEGMTLIE